MGSFYSEASLMEIQENIDQDKCPALWDLTEFLIRTLSSLETRIREIEDAVARQGNK